MSPITLDSLHGSIMEKQILCKTTKPFKPLQLAHMGGMSKNSSIELEDEDSESQEESKHSQLSMPDTPYPMRKAKSESLKEKKNQPPDPNSAPNNF